MDCDECGYKLNIRNGNYVCFACGLTTNEPVFQEGDSAYTNSNESLIQKYNREKNMIRNIATISTITVYKDSHNILKEYCKKNKLKMRRFLSELIMDNCLL